MSLPANWSTVEVRVGPYRGSDGEVISGQVEFSPRPKRLVDVDQTMIVRRKTIAVLDSNGEGAVQLPINNDADIEPSGWTWFVKERFLGGGGDGYDISVTSADIAAGVDLSDRAPEPIVAFGDYRNQFRSDMEALKEATAAIAGADTADDLIAALDADPDSEFRQQQDARLEVLKIVRNVKDYGATGNGSTNDSAAVQAAINAGGITYFPPGVYKCRDIVAPEFGMTLVGASTKGASQSAVVGVSGSGADILTTAPGVIAHNWAIRDLYFEQASGGGHCMSGGWALGVMTGCVFVQPNAGKSAISVSAWVDCSIEGYTNFTHVLNATVPTFKAAAGTGDIAQINFENLRFLNSGNYSIWLEATSGQMIYNVRIINANFEVPTGGAIKLLSCRNVVIENPGMWDMHTAGANKHLIHIGQSTGAKNRFITIRNYLRDASLPPLAGIYDIQADLNTTDGLLLESCGHPLTDLLVYAGNSTGSVVNSPSVALAQGMYLSTEQWQTRNPVITGTGTVVGNGTVTGDFRRRGNTVEFVYRFVLGPTSTIGSGGVTFDLVPIPVNDNQHVGITALFTDAGVGLIDGRALLTSGNVRVYTSAYGNVTATAPFTWAAGDVIEVRGAYRVAS